MLVCGLVHFFLETERERIKEGYFEPFYNFSSACLEFELYDGGCLC